MILIPGESVQPGLGHGKGLVPAGDTPFEAISVSPDASRCRPSVPDKRIIPYARETSPVGCQRYLISMASLMTHLRLRTDLRWMTNLRLGKHLAHRRFYASCMHALGGPEQQALVDGLRAEILAGSA